MSQRITGKVVDRNKYPKQMIFVDKDGYVCVADRPKPISEEEKAKRQRVRDNTKAEAKEVREKLKEKAKAERLGAKEQKAKEAAKLREAISKANSAYKETEKTKDAKKITNT